MLQDQFWQYEKARGKVMGDTREKPGENPYIWLRYTTQFTTGGRTHTIEMGIPMPLGASAETREQLIREAEAGMDQLSRHVENRVTQMLRSAQHDKAANARPQGVFSPPQPSPSSPPSPLRRAALPREPKS